MIDVTTIENFNKHPEAKEIIANWSIEDELYNWARSVDIGWETRHDWNYRPAHGMFHPSSLSNPCDMYLYLELVGGERKSRRTGRQQMVLDTGTAIHLQYQYYQHTHAIRHGYEYDDEVPIWKTSVLAKRLRLAGTVDGIMNREFEFQSELYRMRILWDFKTAKKGIFDATTSVGKHYIPQMMSYMACSQIPVTIVLYICKDNNNLRAFPLYYDDKKWKEIEARLERIIEFAAVVEDPDRIDSYQCRECAYMEDCSPSSQGVRR